MVLIENLPGAVILGHGASINQTSATTSTLGAIVLKTCIDCDDEGCKDKQEGFPTEKGDEHECDS